jgi:hypothetical protein
MFGRVLESEAFGMYLERRAICKRDGRRVSGCFRREGSTVINQEAILSEDHDESLSVMTVSARRKWEGVGGRTLRSWKTILQCSPLTSG